MCVKYIVKTFIIYYIYNLQSNSQFAIKKFTKFLSKIQFTDSLFLRY